jgi:hypothetical protein
MAVQRQSLRLTWQNQVGRAYSLTVDNPRDDVTQTEIETFMDLVITKNLIASSGGDLMQKYDAHLIDTTDNDLYTPL